MDPRTAIYKAYRAYLRRRSDPTRELPAATNSPVSLSEHSPARNPRAVVMAPATLVTALLLSVATATEAGIWFGVQYDDATSDPAHTGVESQEISGGTEEWRASQDVCLARHQSREDESTRIFSATSDPQLDQCYAEQEARAAEIRAESE